MHQETRFRLLISPSGALNLEDPATAPYWIVGDQFLQSYYSIFDFENKRIGLIEAKSDPVSLEKQR